MTKSFLTQDDKSMLEALGRRYEAGSCRAWLSSLILLTVLSLIFGSLLLTSIRQAHRLATHSVPWQEMLYEYPANNWLRGTQAAVHSRFTWGVYGLMASVFISSMFVIRWIPPRVVVRLWRTVRSLEDAVANSEQVVMPSRPPRRTKSRVALFSPTRVGNALPLDVEKRFKIYKRARTDAFNVKAARPVMYCAFAFGLLILGGGPICVALGLGMPWHYGYSMLFWGYEPGQTYTVGEMFIIDHAILAAAILPMFFLMLLLTPRLSSHGRVISVLLVAEMRRLDVLLWRKANGRMAAS